MSQSAFPAFETILYDEPRPGVARVTLNRPEKRNAQNMQMTYDLNSAFDHALREARVKIIVLAAVGPHFSSGHDLSGDGSKTWRNFPVVGTWANFDRLGAEGRHSREMEIYLEITERWRNMSKPMIAQVQGKCMTGGLMLAWCSDLLSRAMTRSLFAPPERWAGQASSFMRIRGRSVRVGPRCGC